MEKHEPQPEVAIVPSLGMGHVIPLIEFARLLVSRFNFSVTLLLPTTMAHQPTQAHFTLLNSLPKPISYTFLPPPDPAHLPDGAAQETTISLTVAHSLPSIRAHLDQRARVVAIITDLFGSDLFDLGRELNIPTYLYFTSTAMCLLLGFRLLKLDKTTSCEYRDMVDPLVLPGYVPLHGKDFMDSARDRKSDAYRVLLYHLKRYELAKGIFINSFSDIEGGAIRALQTEDPNRPPLYPVGPIVRSGSISESNGSECLRWLDQQPSGSVLFVSFGSGGTLSDEQLNELAIGLEKSGHKFLWVVRCPDNESSGSSISVQTDGDMLGYLPKGYINRIKDRGLLVTFWAPQVDVLAHGSIGGFLTHCGWNSVLESITNGVPLIAWPLYAEQNMNAVLLSEGLKVALRPKMNACGIVEANDIVKVVDELMDGEEGRNIRYKMNELRVLAKNAMSENGDSMKSLSEVTLSWS